MLEHLIIVLLITVLLAGLCAADFLEVNAGGDAEVAVSTTEVIGSIFSGIPFPTGTYSGGTSSWLVRQPMPVLYDVIIHMTDSVYQPGDEARAKIVINNTGDVPDSDTVLTYFLVTPLGKVIEGSKEQFMEVPPGQTILYKTISIPELAPLGRYKFFVVYETSVQPRITVYDTFELVERARHSTWPVVLIIVGGCLAGLMVLRRLRYHGVI